MLTTWGTNVRPYNLLSHVAHWRQYSCLQNLPAYSVYERQKTVIVYHSTKHKEVKHLVPLHTSQETDVYADTLPVYTAFGRQTACPHNLPFIQSIRKMSVAS